LNNYKLLGGKKAKIKGVDAIDVFCESKPALGKDINEGVG